MKYTLKVNDYPVDGFEDDQSLVQYIKDWARGEDIVIQTPGGESAVVTPDEMVQALKVQDIVCETPTMCEMGDDYVDIRLTINY